MKKIIVLIAITVAISSCIQHTGKAVVDPATVTNNLMSFLYYKRDHLRLAEDFTALTVDNKPMSKKQFLQSLTSGNYLPLQLYATNGEWCYKLYKLDETTNTEVKETIAQYAKTYLTQYEWEGRPFPAFSYVDLKGENYTPESIKGKIMVLKSWFIACQACNEEMPELNKLTEQYKHRKDILFVSIAFDSRTKLQDFAKHHQFNYAIVPVNAEYIQQTLGANIYPTHWIINKKGMIVKMVNDPNELIAALNKEALK